MSTKTLLKILLFINIILALSGVEIEYNEHTINSMKTSMFKSKKENIFNNIIIHIIANLKIIIIFIIIFKIIFFIFIISLFFIT